LACYYDHDDQTVDSTAVNFSGTTTDATRYLQAFTPIGGTESINKQRHSGVWDANKYILDTGTGEDFPILLSHDYIRIIGLQIDQGKTYFNAFGIVANGARGGCHAIANIVAYTGGGSSARGIEFLGFSISATNFVINNIVYDFTTGIFMRGPSATELAIIYNNTVVDCTVAGIKADLLYVIAKNNIVFNCVDGWLEIAGLHTDTDNNMGDDATGPANDSNYVQTTQAGTDLFVDYSGDDFHKRDTSSDLHDAGLDLSADSYYAFSDDIDGDARPSGTWDMGADEGVSGGVTVIPYYYTNLLAGGM
jgi:hypothetical protein